MAVVIEAKSCLNGGGHRERHKGTGSEPYPYVLCLVSSNLTSLVPRRVASLIFSVAGSELSVVITGRIRVGPLFSKESPAMFVLPFILAVRTRLHG
jgi:hypothetical protein